MRIERRVIIFGALSALLLSCGQPRMNSATPPVVEHQEPDAGAVDAGAVDAGLPTRTVTITEVNDFFDEHGASTQVEGLQELPTLRIVDSRGGAVSYSPVRVGKAVEFREVPEGTYQLEFAGLVFESAASHLDLGSRKFGRADLVRTRSPVELTLTVADGGSALLPTEEGDEMVVFSAGAGLVQSWQLYPNWPLGEVFNEITFDYSNDILMTKPGLIDSDKGDVLYVLFSRLTDLSDDTFCSGMTSVAEAHPRMGLGANAVDLNFVSTETLPSSMFALKWRRSEWSQLGATVHPSPSFSYSRATLRVAPGGGSAYDDSLLIKACLSNAATDLDLAVPSATFFPATWTRSIATEFVVHGPKANGVKPIGTIWAKGESPRVRPPTQLKLSGNDAADVLVVTSGKSMEISWAPPPQGPQPQLYRVALISEGEAVHDVMTTARSVVVPSNRLVKGKVYFVVVTAIETTVPVTSPLRAERERESFADALSNAFIVR